MPLTFEYDAACRLLTTTAVGVISIDDVVGAELPEVAPGAVELFDARRATGLGLSHADVRRISALEIEQPTRIKRMAIVIGGEDALELARTYQTMTVSTGTEVAIFRDAGEATRWLGVADAPD